MDMNEKDAFIEKINMAVSDMQEFLAAKSGPAAALVKEAQHTAEDILGNFQQELRRRDEELIVLRKENGKLKEQLGDIGKLRETIAGLNEKLERMKRDTEQAFKERDEAKGEVMKLQELWQKFTVGE
jgi:predicted RNase H-like nuclease (RuvC/YqgF family)